MEIVKADILEVRYSVTVGEPDAKYPTLSTEEI